MSARISAALAAISMFAPHLACAETQITYVDEASGAVKTVIRIADGKVRMDSGASEGWSLYDSETGTLTTVDTRKRSYTVLDEEKLRALSGQVNDAMATMRKQLEQMPPEQRAAMEKMMGGMGAATGKSAMEIAVDRTGKRLTKGGHDCRQVFLSVGSFARMELCVVDESEIDMPDADRETLASMQKMMKTVAESVTGGDRRAPLDYKSLGGMPVYMKPGNARSGEMLKDVAHDVDASLFTVPAGYREEKLSME